MSAKLFQPKSTKGIFRRGGLLQGPRLIAAILLVVFIIFYLGSTEPIYDLVDDASPAPSRNSGAKSSIERESREKQGDAQLSETSRNKLSKQDSSSQKNGQQYPIAAPKLPGNKLSTASGLSQEALSDPVCQVLAKGTEDLLVIVKTPAADLYSQLPSRFLTNLRCAPLILFSYVKHKIGSYVVHDALSHVSKETREKHKEFKLYDKIQSASKGYQDLSQFGEDSEHNLDKWTVIPALLESYRLYPKKKWYVLIEGDTYLSLPNIMSWIGQLDPEEPFYAGAQTLIGTTELGASGAGIIFSRAALSKLNSVYREKQAEFESMLATSCCGDQVLAEALRQAGIPLHRSWPNTQNESPVTIDWSSKHWCMAAVTWHRMTPTLMDMVYQFESKWILDHAPKPSKEEDDEDESHSPPPHKSQRWFKRAPAPTSTNTAQKAYIPPKPEPTPLPRPDFTAALGLPPILYKDIFEGVLLPLISETTNRTDWDNLSLAHVITGETRGGSQGQNNLETCRAACDIRSRCIQYAHEPGKCHLGVAPRIGQPVSSDRSMKSGWIPHRIKSFGTNLGTCHNREPFFMPEKKQGTIEVEKETIKGESEVVPAGVKKLVDEKEEEDEVIDLA